METVETRTDAHAIRAAGGDLAELRWKLLLAAITASMLHRASLHSGEWKVDCPGGSNRHQPVVTGNTGPRSPRFSDFKPDFLALV